MKLPFSFLIIFKAFWIHTDPSCTDDAFSAFLSRKLNYLLNIVLLMFIFHYQRFNIFTQIIMRWSFIQRMEICFPASFYSVTDHLDDSRFPVQPWIMLNMDYSWRWNPITLKWQIQSVFRSNEGRNWEQYIKYHALNLRRHDLYDFYFYIFMYIYNHQFHWQFLPVSSNRSSKTDSHLIKISLVFVCYLFVDHSYMIFQQDLGNILYSLLPVFFIILKETNLMLPASLFVMLTACCLGSLLMLSIIHSAVIFHPHGQSTEFYQNDRTTDLLVFADIILYKLPENISLMLQFPQCLVWRIACISHAVLLSRFTYIPYIIWYLYLSWSTCYFSMMLTLLVFVFLLYVLFYTIIHSYVKISTLEGTKILEIQAKNTPSFPNMYRRQEKSAMIFVIRSLLILDWWCQIRKLWRIKEYICPNMN